MDNIETARYVTKLDLLKAYCQVTLTQWFPNFFASPPPFVLQENFVYLVMQTDCSGWLVSTWSTILEDVELLGSGVVTRGL